MFEEKKKEEEAEGTRLCIWTCIMANEDIMSAFGVREFEITDPVKYENFKRSLWTAMIC